MGSWSEQKTVGRANTFLLGRTDRGEVTWRGWDGAAAAGECAGHTAKERRRRDGSSWLKDDDE